MFTMKKRVCTLCLLLVCILGLTACGNQQDPAAAKRQAKKDQQSIEMGIQLSVNILQTLSQVQKEGNIESLLGEDDTTDKLVNNYISGMEDVGEIAEMGDAEAKVDGKKVVVDIPITGTLAGPNGDPRTATVEMIMKADGSELPDLSVNPDYTSGELMTKAGLNTLLGMGVTFTILILISLIISSFTLIGKVQNKSKEQTGASVSVENAVRQIVAGEEQSDDSELIAVISAAIAA